MFGIEEQWVLITTSVGASRFSSSRFTLLQINLRRHWLKAFAKSRILVNGRNKETGILRLNFAAEANNRSSVILTGEIGNGSQHVARCRLRLPDRKEIQLDGHGIRSFDEVHSTTTNQISVYERKCNLETRTCKNMDICAKIGSHNMTKSV